MAGWRGGGSAGVFACVNVPKILAQPAGKTRVSAVKTGAHECMQSVCMMRNKYMKIINTYRSTTRTRKCLMYSVCKLN